MSKKILKKQKKEKEILNVAQRKQCIKKLDLYKKEKYTFNHFSAIHTLIFYIIDWIFLPFIISIINIGIILPNCIFLFIVSFLKMRSNKYIY